MRFDIHLRRSVRERLNEVATEMAAVHRPSTPDPYLQPHLVEDIKPFGHTTSIGQVYLAGVDGTGDHPSVSYADSFVYATVAAARLYKADALHGQKEVDAGIEPLIEFTWLSGGQSQRIRALFKSFERLVGLTIEEVIDRSDYKDLKCRGVTQTSALRDGLIVPAAHDFGNLGIQLRTTAELAAAYRLIEVASPGTVVLTDGTMTLPFVHRPKQSLFFEHLRRLCCVRARERGIVFASLSKSHGLPNGVPLEEAAIEKLGDAKPEHWFLRLPVKSTDGWSPVPEDGPHVPPVGALSYLVRFHQRTPIMRLDTDAAKPPRTNDEVALFEVLDYFGHDQRCFGYPYPIKAAHDRASLTSQERAVLRKQLIDAAVATGMKRSLFKNASEATGHA